MKKTYGIHGQGTMDDEMYRRAKVKLNSMFSEYQYTLEKSTPQDSGILKEEIDVMMNEMIKLNKKAKEADTLAEVEAIKRDLALESFTYYELKQERTENTEMLIQNINHVKEINQRLYDLIASDPDDKQNAKNKEYN